MYRDDSIILSVIVVILLAILVFTNLDKISLFSTKVTNENYWIVTREVKNSDLSEKNKTYIYACLCSDEKDWKNKYIFSMMMNGKKVYNELDDFTKAFVNAFLMVEF